MRCRLHDVFQVDQHEGCWVCNIEERLLKKAKAASTAVPFEQSSVSQDHSSLSVHAGRDERKWISEEFDVVETTVVTFVPKSKKA